MHPSMATADTRKKRRRQKRRVSVFGWALAQMRRDAHSVPGVLRKLFGPELGRAVWQCCTLPALREGHRGAMYLRKSPRKKGSPVVARIAITAVRILEHTGVGRQQAMSFELWQGRVGCRAGLAGRVGVSLRQLQRYLRALRSAIRRVQPRADSVAEHLRGRVRVNAVGEAEQWAFCCYRWQYSLPRATVLALSRWRHGRAASPPTPH